MIIGVTGGTGFVGQNLLPMYSSSHSFIVATSRTNTDGSYNHPNVEYVFSDYSLESYKKVFYGCDAIIHIGAVIPDPKNIIKDELIRYLPNVTSSVNLFDAARSLGISNIVNVSSGAVYSHTTLNSSEKDVDSPKNFYGLSKLLVEKVAEYYNYKYDMKIKSLRCSRIFGIEDKESSIMFFISKCLSHEKICIYGRGESGFDYIYVKDVARAIMFFLEMKDKGFTVNIGSGRKCNNNEFIPCLCEVFNNENNYYYDMDKEERIENWHMNVGLANSLGYKANYSIYDAFVDMKEELEKQHIIPS